MAWTAPRTWVDGELVTAALMNTHVRDNLNTVRTVHKYKASDQTVTVTTLTNDTDLVVPVLANEVWMIDTYLLIDSNATADFKCTWTVPAGATMKWAPVSYVAGTIWWMTSTGASTTALLNATDVDTSYQSLSAGNINGINIKSIAVIGGTAGNVQFQWAQVAASANTILKAGSCLIAHRVST